MPLSRAEIVAGRRGQPTARVIGEHGQEAYLHSLYDPVGEVSSYLPASVDQETLVFLGTGLGYHVEPVLAAHPHVTRVVIVEIYSELAASVAARFADSGIKVDIVTVDRDGTESDVPSAPAGLDAAFLQIIPHPPSLNANPTWYAKCRAMIATAGQLHHGKPAREESGRPLTVCVLFGAYYGQLECIRGLEMLGHRVVTVDYHRDETTVIARFTRALLEERPDLVFSINMRGFDSDGAMAEMLRRLGVPLSVWFVDSPEFILQGSSLPPREITTVHLWDRSYAPMVEKMGYRTTYLPLAADPALQDAAVHDSRFRCDISFVGNSLVSGFLSRLAVRFPQTPKTAVLMERAVQAVLASRGGQLEALSRITDRQHLAGQELLFFRAYALHSATTRYRTTLLEPLLGRGLAFFGDPPGWQAIFGDGITTHPDVNYFHETPSVYVSSQVNFNATSLQMPMAVNQRVFDVPLCGGFLLTDRQESLVELFEDDEVAYYGDVEEAADKAAHYLSRPGARQSIRDKARRRVETCHTYQHRMREMLQQAL